MTSSLPKLRFISTFFPPNKIINGYSITSRTPDQSGVIKEWIVRQATDENQEEWRNIVTSKILPTSGIGLVKIFASLSSEQAILSFADSWGSLLSPLALVSKSSSKENTDFLTSFLTFLDINDKSLLSPESIFFTDVKNPEVDEEEFDVNADPDILYIPHRLNIPERDSRRYNGEPLFLWYTEKSNIKIAIALVNIIKGKKSGDYEQAKDFLDRIGNDNRYIKPWYIEEFSSNYQHNRFALITMVNENLYKHIRPALLYTRSASQLALVPRYLLGYLWYQIAILVAGTQPAQCQSCGAPLLRIRTSKCYCNDTCRQAAKRARDRENAAQNVIKRAKAE